MRGDGVEADNREQHAQDAHRAGQIGRDVRFHCESATARFKRAHAEQRDIRINGLHLRPQQPRRGFRINACRAMRTEVAGDNAAIGM